jgi:hypothetical protein
MLFAAQVALRHLLDFLAGYPALLMVGSKARDIRLIDKQRL